LKLYFAKLDIKNSFDTIVHDKLLERLDSVISEEEYLIHKYSTLYPVGGKVRKKFHRNAKRSGKLFCRYFKHNTQLLKGEFKQFVHTASVLAQKLWNTVFCDRVVYPFVEKHRLMNQLRQHITNNMVKIGSRLYRQTGGIPQGSILSSLLCE